MFHPKADHSACLVDWTFQGLWREHTQLGGGNSNMFLCSSRSLGKWSQFDYIICFKYVGSTTNQKITLKPLPDFCWRPWLRVHLPTAMDTVSWLSSLESLGNQILWGSPGSPEKNSVVYMGFTSKNRGKHPQNGWFIMENPITMDDLGVPLFSETSIWFQRWHHVECGSNVSRISSINSITWFCRSMSSTVGSKPIFPIILWRDLWVDSGV